MPNALAILDLFQQRVVARWQEDGVLTRQGHDALTQAEQLRKDIIFNRQAALLDWVDADYPELAEAAGAALCL